MEQSSTSALLQGTVLDLASDVVSALRSGDHVRAGGTLVAGGPGDGVARAAVRVLGADLLLPTTLLRLEPGPGQLALFQEAVAAHQPRPDAAPAVAWSHWAMTRALHRLGQTPNGPLAGEAGAEPDAGWLDGAGWQYLTHQLAVLAPLALPGEENAVMRAARRRPVDVARGFVRAVRRRDWQQAAGAGRWLTLLDGVPVTLGLDAGLDFVRLMGGGDPRVALQLEAARLMPAGVLL
ncbi:hypothetical protein ACFUVV_28585 [Streptomyces sp. NPDC057376]|uniref:hypothetical protein n=1 Tax=unclassified Streptomyces TaxID=2593676 RepID=UPI00093C4219|nr:hypothetical protein [Streptomyces sp. CB02414]OKI85539.1 hypothetical protein AMK11_18280 [Streptomyces sp. CB02414]